jgi:hypothetical protein
METGILIKSVPSPAMTTVPREVTLPAVSGIINPDCVFFSSALGGNSKILVGNTLLLVKSAIFLFFI